MPLSFDEYMAGKRKPVTFDAFMAEKVGTGVAEPEPTGSFLDAILGTKPKVAMTEEELFSDKTAQIRIPRFDPAKAFHPRAKFGTTIMNAILGLGVELPLNLPGMLSEATREAQFGGDEPTTLDIVSPEGELQAPEILKGIVTPAAKLAAGVKTKGETEAGRELFEESLKESMTHPESIILPFLIAAGARGAGRGRGVAARAKAPTPRGVVSDIIPKERIPTERVPIVEEVLGVEKAKVAPRPAVKDFKVAGKAVDGRTVGDRIPNQESIGSTLEGDYEILPGIREVPMSEFEGITGKHYSVQGNKKIAELTNEISKSNKIDPLIVVVDSEGAYILEGATRVDALHRLKAKSFPAQVVLDESVAKPTPKPKLEVAKREVKPAVAPKVEPLKPVGETAESLLAVRTEADAIAKKLTSDFGELPQYKTMNMAEQAGQAQNIIAKDYNQAKRMAMGEEPPPAGLREASIYEGVKLRALKEGDVQTLMELATESEIPTKLSEYGQAIKAADSKIMNDPVKVMQDVSNTRIERSNRTGRKSTNAEVERLRGELETLQKAFDERVSKVTRRTPVKYGSKNRIVDQSTYEKARREIIQAMNTLTANPILNPKVAANAARVGAYHMEAGTRLFADWSGRMVNDLGDWVKPHLEDIWKQTIEDKKLRTALKAQKTRLINETETFTNKLETLDFTKQEKRNLSLDKEARELKRARDRAKENYNAALNTSKSVSKAEAQKIVELSRLTEEARVAMEKGGNRYDYGAARVAYENYVNELKGDKAKLKTQLRERGQEFKTTFKEHKTKAVFDVGKDALKVIRDNSVAIVASWDNSFMGRQGLKTLMTHPTIWAKGAGKSFTDFAQTLGGKKTHDALMADIYSRKNYLNENYQKAKILTRAEEEYPTSLPERVPGLGRVFKASENAFVGSAIRMRTGLFDLLNERARANGIDVTSKAHLEPLGKMINSLTARGQWGKRGEPAIVRVFLWAPKMIKANLDVLTAHGAGVGLKSKFARRQAAINLTKIVAETATVLAIADALHPGSVEWDPRSTKFGRITIGDTTYDITGGAGAYVVLASRLLTNERKNLSGKVKEFGAGFGQPTRFDALSNFLTNKLTPPVGVVADWLRDRDFKGDPFVIEEALAGAVTPISVQEAVGLKDNASADRVAGVILDAIGIGSFSIDDKPKKKKSILTELSIGG